MLALVVDTAGTVGGVLLARNEETAPDVRGTEVLGTGRLDPREFSRQLIPSIAELLQANQLTLHDIDAFAVISGPGSFTGLRVGLSAMKALAEVTSKPMMALSRLAVMVSAADVSSSQTVHAVLDAGRGEFYHGIYRDEGRICVSESLQTITSLAVSVRNFPGPVVATEPAVLDVIGTLAEATLRAIPAITVREAWPLVLSTWQSRHFSDVALLDANYLRRLDVEGGPRAPSRDNIAGGHASLS